MSTILTDRVVKYLLDQDDVAAVVIRSKDYPEGWIFEDDIYGKVASTGQCAIVISEVGQHASPNQHNTMRFPNLLVDVWADVSRNADLSVKRKDAQARAERVHKILRKHFDLKPNGRLDGGFLVWGSDEQIAAGQGIPIFGSTMGAGPDVSLISNGEGAVMSRVTYYVQTI